MSQLQQRLNRQGQKYIAGLQNTVKALWASACKFEGIPVDSKFVIFNDNNKFAKFLDIAQNQLIEAREQYRTGGYVGLSIRNRRIA